MKVKGQLEDAQLHNKSTDPTNTPEGLVWVNTAENKAKAIIGGVKEKLATESYVDAGLAPKATTAALTAHTSNTSNPHAVTKAQVGLGNCDDTSDANKPISTATQTALNLKADSSTLTAHTSASTAHGTSSALVGVSDSQVLTNKDIDGGTASNSRRITLPKATKATLDGLTRKEATMVYSTDRKKAYVDDGSQLVEVGSGSGGSKNFITGGDAESGVIGSGYNDGAAVPTTANTAGTPKPSFTVNSSSPLSGTQSFIWAPVTSGGTGAGWSIPFTIERAYVGRVLEIKFDYEFASYSFYQPGDLAIYIITPSGAVIQPVGYQVPKVNGVGQFKATFQTEITGTSYKLLFHQTTANDYGGLWVDSISVGPQSTVNATLITDWQSYTPTLTNGTNATVAAQWKRIGDTIYIRGGVYWTGAGSGADVTVSVPSGVTIVELINSEAKGGGYFYTPATGFLDSNSRWYSSTSIAFTKQSAGRVNGTDGVTNAVLAFAFESKVPGWSSGGPVSASDAGDGRVIRTTVNNGSGAAQAFSVNVSAKVAFNTIQTDTGAFNTSLNRYTAQVPGTYCFDGTLPLTPPASSGVATVYLYKNGSIQKAFQTPVVASTYSGAPFSFQEDAVAGDYFEIWFISSVAISINTNAAQYGGAQWNIRRLGGNSSIVAGETVACRYLNTAGTPYSAGTDLIIPYPTKDYDTHGTMVSSGVITFPVSGKFDIQARISWNETTGQPNIVAAIQKWNGSSWVNQTVKYMRTYQTGTVAGVYSFEIFDTLNVLAGDQVRIAFNDTTAGSLSTTPGHNVLTIKRVGN